MKGGTTNFKVSQAGDETYSAGSITKSITCVESVILKSLYSANAIKKNYSVAAGASAIAVSSEYISVTGGSMTVSNGQGEAKNLTYETGNAICFGETNGNTFYGVALSDDVLKEGDIISADVYTRSDYAIGLRFSTSATWTDQGDAVAEAPAQESAWISISYTVQKEDGICGESAFNIFRSQGKTTYFKNFTISRLAVVASINAQGYSTFSFGEDVQIVGAKAYKATVSGTTIKFTEIESGLVPANNGVLLYKEGTTEATTVTAFFADEAPAIIGNNLLSTNGASVASYDWVLSGNTFKRFTGNKFPKNKAYICFSSNPFAAGAALRIVMPGQVATDVENNEVVNASKIVVNGQIFILRGENIYDLNGNIVK